MSEIAVAQTAPASWGRRLAWGLGSVVIGGFVPWMFALLAIGAGMLVVVTLGLDETYGAPTYLAFLVAAGLAYAGFIYGVIRLIGTRAEIPWLVWPALLVAPVLGLLLTGTLADPAGVLESPATIPSLLGIAVAFITLGKRRWDRSA